PSGAGAHSPRRNAVCVANEGAREGLLGPTAGPLRMSRDLTDADQAKLLARAQKLDAAQLSGFGVEARPYWDAERAERFKCVGEEQQLRKQLIDAGLAEVIQPGARS